MSYACDECKKPFENGEFVLNGKKNYHHVYDLGQETMPLDCGNNAMLKGEAQYTSGNIKIFYEGKLLSLDNLSKLPNARELKVGYNKEKNGSIIIGNLEELIVKKENIEIKKETPKENIIRKIKNYFKKNFK